LFFNGKEEKTVTEQDAIKKIRAEHAAYMRDWRKRNPEKVREIERRYREKKIQRYMREEGKSNE